MSWRLGGGSIQAMRGRGGRNHYRVPTRGVGDVAIELGGLRGVAAQGSYRGRVMVIVRVRVILGL